MDLAPLPIEAQRPAPDDPVTVLGLESTCDDTAAAVVRVSAGGAVEVLAEAVLGQDAAHAPFGGVVPEIAARAHAVKLDGLIADVMVRAALTFPELSAVAATAGPGLVGGVLVATSAAKAVAVAAQIPFIAVNHLEAHALSPRLSDPVDFPYLTLLVSGGHTLLVRAEGIGRYTRLGASLDDAAGEAFDKAAKLMGLGMPGGPAIEACAMAGDPERFALPRPLVSKPQCDFSFAGLKTAVARAWADSAQTSQDRADLSASVQTAIADCLADRTTRALTMAGDTVTGLAVVGGVAANQEIRTRLQAVARAAGLPMHAPPLHWCTDNGAMVALAGAERLLAGYTDALDTPARARWPLDEAAATAAPASGSGKKGPKA